MVKLNDKTKPNYILFTKTSKIRGKQKVASKRMKRINQANNNQKKVCWILIWDKIDNLAKKLLEIKKVTS